MNLNKSRMLLAGAASVFALAACNMQNTPPAGVHSQDGPAASAMTGGVAATVNGAPIRESLVAMMLKQRTDLGRPASPDVRNAYIDRLAMQLVIAQEAVKKGMDKNPEVADQIELSRQSVLVNAFIQDYLKTHPVTEEMAKGEYDKMKAQMSGTEYKARHILVEKEADAKDIIAKLKKDPKAFDALAKEKSKDPGSKDRGGDLGWFDPRGMVPEFGAAVAKLPKGKLSEEPVKTQFGYHVLKVEDSRPKSPPPFDQVKAGLMQQMEQRNMQQLFDEMKSKAKIEIAQTATPAEAKPAPAESAKPAEAPAKK